MTPSEPSASKPRNVRIATTSYTPEWEDTVRLQPSASGAKAWKVQLELEPEQIALLHSQGLARGALVRRDGSEEWRPLLATPELLRVLSKGGELQPMPLDIEFETPTRSLKVTTLKVTTRPTPPPPPVELCVELVVPQLRRDSIPDWNDVPTGPIRLPVSSTISPATIESQAEPRTAHARPLKLSVAVAATLVLALLGGFGVLRLSRSSAQHAPASSAPVSAAKPAQQPSAATAPSPLASSVPVVSVRDLPTEAKRTGLAAEASAKTVVTTTGSAFDEVLDKALEQAARDASACGASPMTAPVVVTFAPTGMVRFVRFATAVPEPPVRACALRAVARTRIPAFKGDGITVSKTLNW